MIRSRSPMSCRAEMKNKLMAAMEQKNSSGEFEDDGLLHSTQEIKLAPRKRSAGKTAAIAGSAAAVIAVFAVGAGVMLSRNGMPSAAAGDLKRHEGNLRYAADCRIR